MQANSILERHLIVSDRVYTMNDLKNMSIANDALILNTVRDQLKLRISEHDKRKLFIHFFLLARAASRCSKSTFLYMNLISLMYLYQPTNLLYLLIHKKPRNIFTHTRHKE